MPTRFELTIRADELCQRVSLSVTELHEIVAHGIVEPCEVRNEEWMFAPEVLATLTRATRLHRDLHIDWPGVALALELLESLEAARRENEALRQRLGRHER